MLTFRTFEEIGHERWDAIVHESPEGWAWSTSQWRRVILNVEPWGLQDFSFGAFDDDRLVAVMLLQYQASSRRMASTGWSAGGVTMAADLADHDRHRVTAAMVDHARALATAQGAATLDIILSPLRKASLANPTVNPMVAYGFDNVSTQSLVADLTVSEHKLWMGLSKDARQSVKRAEAAGYRVVSGGWSTHAADYYPVHVETYTRTGVHPHPPAYFDGLAREMAPAGLAELWVGLAPNGDAVAFHNDTHFHHARVYHTGCCRTAHLDSGINYLLFWAALKGARDAGCTHYEIGEIFPDATEGKSRGLTVFKSKFGGTPHGYFRGRMTIDAPPPAATAAPDAAEQAEQDVRAKFERSETYEPSRICRRIDRSAPDYAGQLLLDRFDLVAKYNNGGTVVDLCCAAGSHLVDISPDAHRAIGVDFATRYLETGRDTAAAAGRENVSFVQADARQLPFASGTVDLLYCFSALYAIPKAEDAVREAGRVLRPGGHAILDFGNGRSLNAYCAHFYPEFTTLHTLTVRQIRAAVRASGMTVVEHRRFQLLPLWADRPSWLWPLLHPRWKSIMKRRVFGRMLDEWCSMLPIFRAFAFRHVLVCRKPE